VEEVSSSRSFFARHEFAIRRLFSLSGLVPVGAYMCIHLLTNSSLLGGHGQFQRAVYQIHSLGALLPVVEWVFIFLPIIFHATLGVVIIRGGLPNNGSYAYGSNLRYTLQRATGLIALIFIFTHVFHMHGWFHFDWWLDGVAEPLGGAQFKPYNASSTLALAFQKSVLVPILYTIGVLSCVFHLSNGIWSFGVRWGLWTTPAAMQRAGKLCVGFGLLLACISLGAVAGPIKTDVKQAREYENRTLEAKIASGDVEPNPHKTAEDLPAEEGEAEATDAAATGAAATDAAGKQPASSESSSTQPAASSQPGA
jgi:succinate dehydrogenase / fumarate reductase cytochrome b subunit